jgi:Meiotically Up-regulated Gene 113 (MUG113) protein
MSNPIGYIYLLQMGPYYKIGKTIDKAKRPFEIVRRINGIEPNLPYSAEFVMTFDCFLADMDAVERLLHARFADSRMRGEWFMLSHEDRLWLLEQEEIPFWPHHCVCDCRLCADTKYAMLEQIPSPS